MDRCWCKRGRRCCGSLCRWLRSRDQWVFEVWVLVPNSGVGLSVGGDRVLYRGWGGWKVVLRHYRGRGQSACLAVLPAR